MTEAKRMHLVDRLRKMAAEPLIALSDHPALLEAASALATPASDGLPEGWKANAAQRGTDLHVYLSAGGEWFATHKGCGYSLSANVKSLSEACLAANERFPVVMPEAPAKWVPFKAKNIGYRRETDGAHIHRINADCWVVIMPDGEWISQFKNAEEAMAWADRERPVA